MIYLNTYILLIALNIFAIFSNSKVKFLIYTLSMCILIFLVSLRYHIGWDWEVYDYFFNNIKPIYDPNFSLDSNNFFGWEPLFILFSSILAIFTNNQYFIISFLSMATLYIIVLKFLGNKAYLFIIPFTFFGYIDSFSVLRQEIATILMLSALYFFYINKKKQAIILFIIAFFFHYSILFIVITFFILYYFILKLYKKILWILFLSFIIIYFNATDSLISSGVTLLQPYLSDALQYKLNSYTEEGVLNRQLGFTLRYLELVILILIPYVFKNKFILADDKKFKIFYTFIFLNFILYTLLNNYGIFWERFVVYCWIGQSIYIAYILGEFGVKVRFLFSLVMYLSITVHHYQYWNSSAIDIQTNYERFYPYKSILDNVF